MPADAGGGAPLLRARAANRVAAGRDQSVFSAKKSEDGPLPCLEFVRPARCPTSRPFINACWPTRPTCCCLTPPDRARKSVFDKDIMAASLDHALWFHRPFRADEWLLYAQGQPEPVRLARLCPWPDLRARRHAGRLGGARRAAAAAPGRSRADGAAPRARSLLALRSGL